MWCIKRRLCKPPGKNWHHCNYTYVFLMPSNLLKCSCLVSRFPHLVWFTSFQTVDEQKRTQTFLKCLISNYRWAVYYTFALTIYREFYGSLETKRACWRRNVHTPHIITYIIADAMDVYKKQSGNIAYLQEFNVSGDSCGLDFFERILWLCCIIK